MPVSDGAATTADPLRAPLILPCGLRLKNRLAKAAMTEGLADEGLPTSAHALLYKHWAEAGFGLLVTGNVQIDADGLERPGNVLIDAEPASAVFARFEAWADAAHRGGARILMQLSHAGRQTPAAVNPSPKGPSAIPLRLPGRMFGRPVELTDAEIEVLIDRYAAAASVAMRAGFDGVQLHAAHGYLIAQFLSPLSNRRTDRWGGSLENRARFLLAIVAAVRAATAPSFAVSVKLNTADFLRGGFRIEDCIQVAGWLHAADVDLLEVSGGSYEQPAMLGLRGLDVAEAPTDPARGYFRGLAEQLIGRPCPPLLLTGGLRSRAAMIDALDAGIAMTGVARPACGRSDAIGAFLSGDLPTFERPEDHLALGPGVLGRNSASRAIKMLNGFGALAWFNQAIRRKAEGLRPEDPHILVALFRERRADRAALRRMRR